MQSVPKPPSILLIMLCLRCTLGGAEKRYARVFEMLINNETGSHKLLINRSLLNLLQAAGILNGCDDHLIVVEPPSMRFSWLTKFHSFALFIDLLWYVCICEQTMRTMRPNIVHPLLTGVYLSLPGILLHPHIHLFMSAYSYQFESYRDRRIFGKSIGASIKYFAMRRSAMLEALSNSIRDDLITRGLDPCKIIVAPGSFTDLSLCQPATSKYQWVVFVGRFVNIKNPLILAQAIPHVLERYPRTHFWFLGEGPLESQIRQLVQNLNLAEQVSILFDPQPTHILNQSSIFISLQTEENYPSQSLLEAMACANAIIASDVGETWRLVDETTGVRVALNADAVAAGILQLLDDPALPQYQYAARQRIVTEHTSERFFNYIAAAYQTVAQT